MSLWNNADPSAPDRKSPVPMTPPVPERQEPAVAVKATEAPAPAAVAPVAPTPAPGSDLLLGRGARFEGKLTFEGTVRIDARFTGSIVTNDVLVVGEAGRLGAHISFGNLIAPRGVLGNRHAQTAVQILH